MAVRSNLKSLLSLPDPLMNNQYVIESISADVGKLFSGATNFFQNYVESIDIPFKTVEVESRHIMTTKKYYAGHNSFNSFNINFYEDIQGTALKGLIGWQNLIHDKDMNYNPASSYQAEMRVQLLNTHGNFDSSDIPIGTAVFKGVFPTQINPITMSGTEVQRVNIQCSFSVNSVTWTWN
jgi:hypothetical protein